MHCSTRLARRARSRDLFELLQASNPFVQPPRNTLIIMQLVEPLLFVAYYWVCLFCTEERLWAIFAKRPLHTLRTSWFGSKHFVVAYAVAILLFGVALPRSCEAMRRACLPTCSARGG